MYSARVILGRGKGIELGFPTLNLEIPKDFNAREGIYSCTIVIRGVPLTGALHWGPVPVFNETKRSLEVHVIDWTDEEAPEHVSFEVRKFLRPIRDFPTPEALAEQIAKDVASIRSL